MINIPKQLWYVSHNVGENDLAYMTYYEDNAAFLKRKDDAEYINPHLLGAIISGLRETGKNVPDEIEQWADDMWGH